MSTQSEQAVPAVPIIVVGVDGTSAALRAVEWAAGEARLRGLPLQILHAAPYASATAPELGRRRAKEILTRAYTVAHRTEPSVPARTRGSTDQPAEALLAASASAELMVLGMRSLDPGRELILGSTALSLSGRAGCPVIVARGRRSPRDTTRPVLAGVDHVGSDAAVLNFAFADARRHAGPLTIVHARQHVEQLHSRILGTEPAARFVERTQLSVAITPWTRAYPDVPVELRVVGGHPSTALLGSAAHARLLVVSSRGRSAPARVLFGSTSRDVLLRCPTPVAVLPHGVTADPIPCLVGRR